jgi:hypothetical protein
MVHETVGIRAAGTWSGHGLPESHGPLEEAVDEPKVNIRLPQCGARRRATRASDRRGGLG